MALYHAVACTQFFNLYIFDISHINKRSMPNFQLAVLYFIIYAYDYLII